MLELELTVSEFIATLNQTLEYAYPSISITGELANFRVSKGQWVYFDLKDETASLKCFGTVFQLPGPLEDGMLLKVRGAPRMHQLYGFSFNFQTIHPVGAGNLKRAADLLTAKLTAEGLFNTERKRLLPYPPRHIGLITSAQSAAYADFIKILNERWGGLRIDLRDVLVQGELAMTAIVQAIADFNQSSFSPEVLIITRGGGSADDLSVFNTEQVTRAVAGSRIPTLVAIGHEIDVSLAERAADVRASTPSNAAEKLVPDKTKEKNNLTVARQQLEGEMKDYLKTFGDYMRGSREQIARRIVNVLRLAREELGASKQLLEALSPNAALRRGYTIVRQSGRLVRRGQNLLVDSMVDLTFYDSVAQAQVKHVQINGKDK